MAKFEYHTSGEMGRCAATVSVEGNDMESVQCVNRAGLSGLCGIHARSARLRGSISIHKDADRPFDGEAIDWQAL